MDTPQFPDPQNESPILRPQEPKQQANVQLPKGFEAALGLAVACFVLGLISLPFSIIVFGGLFALIGTILAIVHLARKMLFRGLAITGLIFSLLGGLGALGFGVLYGVSMMEAAEMFEDAYGEEVVEYISTPAPDMQMTDLEGNTINLSDLQGKRVVLDFWATWCGPCRQVIPHLIKLSEENGTDDLVIIGISNEDEDTLRTFAKEQKINYPIVSQDDLPEPFDSIYSIPTMVFIDRNGIIQDVTVGAHGYEKIKEKALADDYESPEGILEIEEENEEYSE